MQGVHRAGFAPVADELKGQTPSEDGRHVRFPKAGDGQKPLGRSFGGCSPTATSITDFPTAESTNIAVLAVTVAGQ